MRKQHQIHTLGAPHCKAHFRFLSKLKDKDFKCALWSKKYGTSVMLYQYWHIFSVKNCNRNVINQGIITIILIDKILFVLLQYDL